MYARAFKRALAALITTSVLLAGCGGGDEGGGGIRFTITAVNPDTSTDLTGGDRVTVSGTNFLAAGIAVVRFGATNGINLLVTSDTTLEVTTPPAPGGTAQTVTLEVVSLNASPPSVLFDNAYTYVGVSGPPQPNTISRTQFTATGMESFFIDGSSLGPPNGMVDVEFVGIGRVPGQVNATSTFVSGIAPVSPAAPPSGPITVRVINGTESGDVPAQVHYDWNVPASLGVPGQTNGNASQPVRLADGYAVMCTAGVNGVWGTADDEIVIIQGPPNTVAVTFVGDQNNGNAPVGYLDPLNSIPAVMTETSFCVYSVGGDGAPASGDEWVVLITQAQGTPQVAKHGGPPLMLNTAPLVAISPTRIALTESTDGVLGNGNDAVAVWDFAGGGLLAVRGIVGNFDATPGRGNLSIPVSADGENVFVVAVGNGIAGDGDDQLYRFRTSTMQTRGPTPAPFLVGAPLALSSTTVAAPAGNGIAPGTGVDLLATYVDLPASMSRTTQSLTQPVQTAALVPYARIGTMGIAVAIQGFAPTAVFMTPGSGNPALISGLQPPLFAPLGSQDLLVFDPGPPGLGDERAQLIPGTSAFAFIPAWNQAVPPLTDQYRAFGVGAGSDSVYGTGDERLLVHQTLALGYDTEVSTLPMGITMGGPVTGLESFVPVGPGWGVMQSPGPLPGLTYGGGDDLVIIVRY
jgi:hypothetical protein